MKHLLLLLIATALLATGCSKDGGSAKNCEGNKTISVTFQNTSNNPYAVAYTGGSLFTMSGNSTVTKHDVAANGASISWTQQSGYVLYPTTGSRSINDIPCSAFSVNLP